MVFKKILFILILPFFLYAQWTDPSPKSIQLWHLNTSFFDSLGNVVRDSVAALSADGVTVLNDGTLKQKVFPTTVLLAAAAADSVGSVAIVKNIGQFMYVDSTLAENDSTILNSGTAGKQWILLVPKVDNSTVEVTSSRVVGVKDGGISWNKLSSGVQSSIGGNLYDFQDASINESLQMMVRFAHYIHERYYNEDSVAYVFDGDISGPIYETDRRGLVRYMELLQELHIKTGRAVYLNRLANLYEAVYNNATKTINDDLGNKSCKSVDCNPAYNSGAGWIGWGFVDTRFHLAGRYLYEQDNVAYAEYNEAFKDFTDVLKSYCDSTTYTGFTWSYFWNQPMAGTGNDRINAVAPLMPFFQYLISNNISTDSVSVAWATRARDQMFVFFETQWNDDATYSTGGGGYPLYSDGADINQSYNGVFLFEYAQTIALAEGDTGVVSGIGKRLEELIRYDLQDRVQNINYLMEDIQYPQRTGYFFKIAKEYGLNWNTGNDLAFANATLLLAIKPKGFVGEQLMGSIITWGRRNSLWHTTVAAYIRDLNDVTFNEEYTSVVDHSTWTPTASSYYYIDGSLATNRNLIGFIENSPLGYVGYRTDDTTPIPIDTSLWAVTNGNIVTHETTGIAKCTYTVKKLLGSPFMKVFPDTNDVAFADSIYLGVDAPGDANGNAMYYFYYNWDGELDTLKNSDTSIGDSILFNGKLGLMINQVSPVGGEVSANFYGFFCNVTQAKLYALSDAGGYRVWGMNTTLADSAMFFDSNHEVVGNFLNGDYGADLSNFATWKRFVETLLGYCKKFWDNGLTYPGILEDKIQ